MIPLGELERLCAEATPGPWFVIGPPWCEGAPFINGGSEDPHRGEVICDFTYMGADDDWREVNNSDDNAAFIAACDPLTVAALTRAARTLEWIAEGRCGRDGGRFVSTGYQSRCETCGYHQGATPTHVKAGARAALAPFVALPPAPPTEEEP